LKLNLVRHPIVHLGPGNVAGNVRLGVWALLLGALPYVALYFLMPHFEYDGAGYPTTPFFVVLLGACWLMIPVPILGLIALAMALIDWVKQ
jgi:hypothetical protein